MSAIFKKSDIKAGYLLKVKDTDTGDVFNMTAIPGLPRRNRGGLNH